MFVWNGNMCKILYVYLEDIGEVSEVKDIVELDGRGQEVGGNFVVHSQGAGDECSRIFLNIARKTV